MKKLVRYNVDCGRMGSLDGLFICEDSDLDRIADYGTVSFGEVLGKHSDVRIKFTKEEFEILTDDQDFIDRLEKYVGGRSISGYNPLNYIDE